MTFGGYPFITKDMRLADFILRDMETILAEWEAFAATLFLASAGMTSLALGDHAKEILEAVAKDCQPPRRSKLRSTNLAGELRN